MKPCPQQLVLMTEVKPGHRDWLERALPLDQVKWLPST